MIHFVDGLTFHSDFIVRILIVGVIFLAMVLKYCGVAPLLKVCPLEEKFSTLLAIKL